MASQCSSAYLYEPVLVSVNIVYIGVAAMVSIEMPAKMWYLSIPISTKDE